ncbi:MAG: S8 family serine peptidase [Bacteroidia bacterium]|nr:S8 family serine peptidase [Bacteroidia bacterium]
MKYRYLTWLFCFLSIFAEAQEYHHYFIGFKDKPKAAETLNQPYLYISEKAIQRRLRHKVPVSANDVPPDSGYIARIMQFPIVYGGQTRWMNGMLAKIPVGFPLDSIRKLPFVQKLEFLGPYQSWESEAEASRIPVEENIGQLEEEFNRKREQKNEHKLGKSFTQINQLNYENAFVDNSVPGNGITIAVIDAGFSNMDKIPAFQHLFKEKKLVSTFDFVEREFEVFDDDAHGLAVLTCLAARQPGVLMGTAPNADYILLRSENAVTEFLLEEYFWLQAAEYADSAGADIINSSLGYTKHDNPEMGHKYKEFNGQTTVVSRAAEIAASKGILIFCSAGNEGMDVWRQISTPADAEHVIAIGACDKKGKIAEFSSVGPTADKRIKPDLIAFGKGISVLSESGKIYSGNGTSYASPVIAGTAAWLLSKAPRRSLQEINQAYHLSGSQYFKPNKYVGWGIPDLALCLKMLDGTKESLIDYRVLEDDNVHVCFRVKAARKLELIWLDEEGEELEKESFEVKNPGVYRMESELSSKQIRKAKTLKYSFLVPGQNQQEVEVKVDLKKE